MSLELPACLTSKQVRLNDSPFAQAFWRPHQAVQKHCPIALMFSPVVDDDVTLTRHCFPQIEKNVHCTLIHIACKVWKAKVIIYSGIRIRRTGT